MEDRPELYYVASTFLNAFLLREGYEIVKTSKLDNNKVVLYYDNSDKLHEDIRRFREDKDLKEFITKLKQVQNTIRLYWDKKEE